MQVKRIVKNNEGNVDVTLMLTPEQASFFMQIGMNVLVARGGATIVDYTEEEFSAEQENTTVTSGEDEAAAQQEFLEGVDKDTLPQA